MTMTRRALRDNGATAVDSISVVSSTILLLGDVVSGMVSLETKVLAMWFISFVLLYPLQDALVGKRRCSRHWLVQYTAMAAYYLGTPLMFYVIHVVCSTSTSHLGEPFPIIVCVVLSCLFINLLTSLKNRAKSPFSNMRTYSLHDGPHDPWRFVMSVVYLVYMEWKYSKWIWSCNTNRGLVVRLLLNIIRDFSLVLLYLFFANKLPAEYILDYETKAVAEYMTRESKSSSTPFFDAGDHDDANSTLQLDCCRYPFTQRRKDGCWISIKDLLQRDDLSTEDQDIWLSYSLCRLLARRYYGFHCAEGDANVRCFALADLRRTNNGGYKRAFTIVEVQLAFLHDYFFTTSLQIMESSIYVLPHKMRTTMAEWPQATCIMCISMLPQAVADHYQYHWTLKVVATGSSESCLYFAATMMITFSYLLITPTERLLAIYWRPIHIVFHKLNLLVPTTSIHWRFLKHIYHSPNELGVHRPSQKLQTSSVYWRDKIGQYSLLLDYDRRCSRKKALVAWFLGLVQPQPQYRFIKHLPVKEEDVRVPDSVRKLVAETLRAIDGPPTNGTRSLKINMDSTGYDWSWTCRQQTHTATILIWHIATCYCDMSSLKTHSGQLEDFPLIFHEVATTLSRYCAYLVAFLLEFLPEHSLITKEIFQNVIQDAQRALGLTLHMEGEKCTKIRGLWLRPRCGQTTIHKGIMLGRQLEKLNTRLRWKVMAEFWAETILYVAPSDNAELHIEYLAKGGEFITHLWAMLSNAGILKRATEEWHLPPASTTTTEGPQMHKLMETLSSNDEASTSSMSSPPIETSEPPTKEKGKQPQIMEDCDQ